MSSYMSTITYLSDIEHTFYESFCENIFSQSSEYKSIPVWYHYEPKGNKYVNKQQPPMVQQTVYHRRIHEIFFMLADPIKGMDEMVTEFSVLLDKNKDMLKKISPHHKKLQSDIIAYITNKSKRDTSYLNEKNMLFWSHLFDSNIYIIERNFYKKYSPSTPTDKDILIRFSEQENRGEMLTNFEYISTTFETFTKTNDLYPKVDVTKLNNKTIEELRSLCTMHKIDLGIKKKKSEIVVELTKVLI